MSDIEEKAYKTPNEDLRKEALKHYDKASSSIHHYSSVIPQSINFYFDNKQTIDKLTKEVEYQDKHIEDLNQLSTDRGNEVHKLKEQLKEYEENSIAIHDIRNKLGSITTLIELIERPMVNTDMIKRCSNTAKLAVNYLAKREVFKQLLTKQQ